MVRAGSGLASDALSARRLALDEATEEAAGVPGEPAGFGGEASTSQQSRQVIDTYTVPADRTARLVEAALALESNGQGAVLVNGEEFGPFTGGPTDVNLPFDRAVLLPGDQVVAAHQSTDGASTTTKAFVTVREV